MNADKARILARGRWIEVLISLAPAITPAMERTGHHVPCPVHGGKDGFRTFNDVNQSGGTVCNTCGSFPDGFATLMWLNQWDFKTTLQAVANHLDAGAGDTQVKPVKRLLPIVRSSGSDERLRQALNRTWKEAFPLTDSKAQPGRLYLVRRGINLLPESSVVRFHPSLPYYHGKQWVDDYPAILSMVSDVTGKPVTIHRTYLTVDGYKAPVAFPKKLMRYPGNKVTGGAIRLDGSVTSVLAVAEGLETALSVMEGTALPVWCVINANMLEKFTPPSFVAKVIVFADKDLPTKQHPSGHGQDAAKKLVQRLWQMNIRASLAIPVGDIPPGRKSLDWNDVLQQNGKYAFQPENIPAITTM